MKIQHRLSISALAVSVLVSVAGCGAPPEEAPAVREQPAFRTAACNLGAYWDARAQATRASYTAPTIDRSVTADYGPTIANDRCSDAEVLRWQEPRRDAHDDDTICRIVWFDDHLASITYDIGCAVPVVVTHASR